MKPRKVSPRFPTGVQHFPSDSRPVWVQRMGWIKSEELSLLSRFKSPLFGNWPPKPLFLLLPTPEAQSFWRRWSRGPPGPSLAHLPTTRALGKLCPEIPPKFGSAQVSRVLRSWEPRGHSS